MPSRSRSASASTTVACPGCRFLPQDPGTAGLWDAEARAHPALGTLTRAVIALVTAEGGSSQSASSRSLCARPEAGAGSRGGFVPNSVEFGVAADWQLRGVRLHVNGFRVELGVVSAERGDELRHTLVTAQLAERLRRLAEGHGEPAKDHLASVPAGDVLRRLPDTTVDELDWVRRREGAGKGRREVQAHHRERLVETLAERGERRTGVCVRADGRAPPACAWLARRFRSGTRLRWCGRHCASCLREDGPRRCASCGPGSAGSALASRTSRGSPWPALCFRR